MVRQLWFRRTALPALVSCVLLLGGTASNAAEPGFQEGDLILNSNLFGDLQWLRADGTPVQPLETGDHFATGAEFDPSGRLWVVGNKTDKAYLFDNHGEFVGVIVEDIQDWPDQGNGYEGNPTDIAFDAKGNAYIGSYEFEGPITKFSPTGESLGVLEDSEADHLDLAADQCTLFFQRANDGPTWYKNICTDTPSDWPFPMIEFDYENRDPSESFGLRVLPDATVLLNLPANLPELRGATVRVQVDGTPIRFYDDPNCASGWWFGVTPNEDASSFWSSCLTPQGLVPTEFDIETGSVIRTLSSPGLVQAIYGGFRAAQDRTDPTVTLTTPAPGATYILGQPVVADYACADLGGSDLASCTGNVPDGAAVDTASVGTKSFTVTATDGAGNTASASASYKVVYDFSGFFHPVDNPPTFNVMPAGKGVKLMFKLSGNQGLNVIEPGYPSVSAIACGTPQDTVEKTVKVSQSKLTYEARPQQYVYFWATNNTWRGSCREFLLKLKDETEHRALFRFT